MGQSSLATIGIGHLITLLCGFLGGQRLENNSIREFQIQEAANRAGERCVEACALRDHECETSVEIEHQIGFKITFAFSLAGINLIIWLAWCLCRKRERVITHRPPSEDLSPASLAERRLVAQAQLAEVRSRRHVATQ